MVCVGDDKSLLVFVVVGMVLGELLKSVMMVVLVLCVVLWVVVWYLGGGSIEVIWGGWIEMVVY